MDKEPTYRELDERVNSGMKIQLLWSPDTNETIIRVEEFGWDNVLQFPVLGALALEAFNHPFAFAPTLE